MSLSPESPRHEDIMTDLVEYFVVVVRDTESLETMVPALAEVVRSSAIRILDLVAVTTDSNGVARFLEVDTIGSFDGLRRPDTEIGGLLSSHDIDLVSLALAPDSTAIVLVVEDRWAEPLSAAARQSGGEVLAGERIPRTRVEAALAGLRREGASKQHGTNQDLP
jgi:Family of unknown function (DUF6325)